MPMHARQVAPDIHATPAFIECITAGVMLPLFAVLSLQSTMLPCPCCTTFLAAACSSPAAVPITPAPSVALQIVSCRPCLPWMHPLVHMGRCMQLMLQTCHCVCCRWRAGDTSQVRRALLGRSVCGCVAAQLDQVFEANTLVHCVEPVVYQRW